MDALLIYSVKVAAVLTVFHIIYRLLLQKECSFRINRIVLISSVLLSFLLPLCVITFTKTMPVEQLGNGMAVAGNIGDLRSASVQNPIDWWFIAFLIYGLGGIVVMVYTIYSMICVRSIIKRSTKHRIGSNVSLFVTDKNLTPFSWFNSVVLSQSDYEADSRDVIIAHERAHIALGHFFDLLLVDICCAVQWFNPTVWLLRKELKEIHEYEADSSVLHSGYDARSYQLLLIKKAVCGKHYSTTNSLNHSTLKNRITMMLKKRNSSRSSFKLLYLVPLVLLSLFIFSKTIIVGEPRSGHKQGIQIVVNAEDSISIVGRSGEDISFGADLVALEQYLKGYIKENPSRDYMVNIKVNPKLPMGVITDIKGVFYDSGIKESSISYN